MDVGSEYNTREIATKGGAIVISNETNIGLANMSIEDILLLPIKYDQINYLIT